MVNKRYKKENTLNEAHFEGLLSFARQVRNRFIFFLLFAIYSFLNILSTSDKMLFMQTGIKMPLLNIELPLLAFYVVMPLFLVALHFNLLYVLHTYREYLANAKKNHPLALKSLPFGLYEGALLNRNNFLNRLISIALTLLIYILPLIVLFSFWFRFADYQNSTITYWHLTLLLLDFVIVFYFRGLLGFGKSSSKLKNFVVIGATVFAFSSVLAYQCSVINVINDDNVTIEKLKSLENLEYIIFKKNTFFKDEDWLLPRLVIKGEVLVPIDKELLDVLSDLKGTNSSKKEPLLLSMPLTDYSKRSFKLSILDNSIIVKSNFIDTSMQGSSLVWVNVENSNFENSNMQGANLGSANFKNAFLYNVNLSNSYLNDVIFTLANLGSANLSKAIMYRGVLNNTDLGNTDMQKITIINSNLNNAFMYNTKLKYANLKNNNFQGVTISDSELQGVSLVNIDLKGANLENTNMKNTNIIYVNFEGANLSKVNFINSNFINSNLQGSNLSMAKLQGINCSNVNMQGITTKDGYKFVNNINKKADLSGINRDILTAKNINKILKEIKPHIKYSLLESKEKRLKKIKARLQKAIGKDPIEWVKSQNPNLGVLTKEMADKIAKEVTNKKARERMGLESN